MTERENEPSPEAGTKAEAKPTPVRRSSKTREGKGDHPPGMRPAGVLIRLGARIIDGAIFWVIVFLLGLAAELLGPFPLESFALTLTVLQIAAVATYEVLLTSSSWQGTIGKRVLEIKVVRGAGERLSFAHAFGRYLAYFLILTGLEVLVQFAALTGHEVLAFLLPLLILVGFSFLPRKRLPHDLLASTSVVHLGKGRKRRTLRRRTVKSEA
jgi:uncharacterized RDD family membrane protein YckC